MNWALTAFYAGVKCWPPSTQKASLLGQEYVNFVKKAMLQML